MDSIVTSELKRNTSEKDKKTEPNIANYILGGFILIIGFLIGLYLGIYTPTSNHLTISNLNIVSMVVTWGISLLVGMLYISLGQIINLLKDIKNKM